MKIKLDKAFTPTKTLCIECGGLADKTVEETRESPNLYKCQKCKKEWSDMTDYNFMFNVVCDGKEKIINPGTGKEEYAKHGIYVGGKKQMYLSKENGSYHIEVK